MATYNYTNGDGVSALDASTPDGATEPVSVLDDAVRQIKAYLLDPTKGPQALIDALSGSDVGFIKMFGGTVAPTGYLMCDGSAVSRVTYAALFAVIGVTYGPGDSVTTFNVPDFRGRGPGGAGTGDAAGATAWSVGDKKGEETHLMTEGEMFAHTHTVAYRAYHLPQSGSSTLCWGGDGSQTSSSRGGTDRMPILGPSLCVSFVIKT